MEKVTIALLRGVCQTPAYAAHEMGFFRDEGLDVEIDIAATAWLVPERLARGDCQFAVIPWTRVAAANGSLVALSGSGHDEAAIVIREGLADTDVRRVVVPLRGGIKDLTAMGLIRSLGWHEAEVLRQPSGDGGISARFIREAFDRNLPRVDALRNREAMDAILELMVELGYLDSVPSDFTDLSFLDAATAKPLAGQT